MSSKVPPPVPSRAGRPPLSGPPPVPSRAGRPPLSGPPPVPSRDGRPALSNSWKVGQLGKMQLQQADPLSEVATALTAEFRQEPMTFMRNKVVKPISGAATGAVIARSEVVDRLIDQGTSKTIHKAEVKLQEAGGFSVKYLYMEQNADHIRAQVQKRPRNGCVPVCFLPWGANTITQMTIPEVPGSQTSWDEYEYPNFFFTAALSGCSIFVKGSQEHPTVYHAGLSEVKIVGDSDQFWADQLAALGTGYDKEQLRARLSKNNYLTATRPAAKEYMRWLESKNPGSTLNLRVIENTACFFGIRDESRKWTFYVQEQFVAQKLTISNPKNIKKSTFAGETVYKDKSLGNKGADLIKTSVPRMVGPFQFGNKIKKTYIVTGRTETSPIGVREVYPQRSDVFLPPEFAVEASMS